MLPLIYYISWYRDATGWGKGDIHGLCCGQYTCTDLQVERHIVFVKVRDSQLLAIGPFEPAGDIKVIEHSKSSPKIDGNAVSRENGQFRLKGNVHLRHLSWDWVGEVDKHIDSHATTGRQIAAQG
jgi:hypothetical protein